MNPQDQQNQLDSYQHGQNGSLPPVNPTPVQAPNSLPNAVQIPGGQPLVIQPQQPLHPELQQQVEHSPYEFIINPQKSAKVASPLAGASTQKRAAIFGGGLLGLILVFGIVSSVISNSGHSPGPLLTVAQEQTELVRVATAGEGLATSESTKAFTFAVQLSVATSNAQLNAYLTANKDKLNVKQLSLKHSAAVDTQLQSAQANSTYDSTLTSILQNDLASYSQALKTAYNAEKGPKGRTLLSKSYDGAQLLIQQSHQQED